MAAAELTNPVVATVTPLDDAWNLDTGAYADYLAFLSEAGIPTILVNGTNGEFYALGTAQRKLILECAREHFPGTVIAHVGHSAHAEACDLLQHASDHADAVASIAPYYLANPAESGVEAYFRALLQHTELPFLLYNFPLHTQSPITPGIAAHLAAEFPHLIGIKDTTKTPANSRAFKKAREDFLVYVGGDSVAAHLAELELDGIITGGGNPVPELLVNFARAADQGDREKALEVQARVDAWSSVRKASSVSDLAAIKAALAGRIPGFPTRVCPPQVAATAEQQAEIAGQLTRVLGR